MPKRDDSGDMQCWAIDKPVTYKLQRYGKVRCYFTNVILGMRHCGHAMVVG